MPNHVTHRVILDGPSEEIGRFKQKCIRVSGPEDDGEVFFDFDTLIPMPDSIRDTVSSSSVEYGLCLLEYEKGNADPLKAILTWPWVKEKGITEVEALADYLREKFPNDIEQARRQAENREKYGYSNWYDWSNDQWGTKWNSYNFCGVQDSPETYEFKFDTAWSPPEPIFHALAAEFPKLQIQVYAFDEGWNFAYYGTNEEDDFMGGFEDATDEKYEVVYGEKPEKYEDEDGELPAQETA